MVTRTKIFIQGAWGKCVLYFLMVAMLYMGYGCSAYRQVSMAKTDFMANEQIQRYLADYHLYLHDGTATYAMSDVQIVDGRDLSAKLTPGTYEEPKSDWKRQERKEWWDSHKYDIHIYTNDNLNPTASLDAIPGFLENRVIVSDNMITDIKVMAYDVKESISAALIVLVVILGVVLILLLAIAAVTASGNASQGSIVSDSGSDSDSGSSDSGGSDSGSGSSD